MSRVIAVETARGWRISKEKQSHFISPSGPAAQWTGAMRGPAFFAYADN
jgi:hypothetical protein